VKVVSNASPLISLARVGQLDLLQKLFGRVHLAAEVHYEVVVQGAGRPAAAQINAAAWIDIHPPVSESELAEFRRLHPLGKGELASLLLAKAIRADLVLLDERAARLLAQHWGLSVMGVVGILETGYRRRLVPDLGETYRRLLNVGVYIEQRILNRSLNALGLDSL
jgi:hypothetical protein